MSAACLASRFVPDTHSDTVHGKATRHAAAQVLSRELSMRARRVAAAKNDAFKLTRQSAVVWRGDEVATLSAGEDPLKPTVTLIADESLQGADRDKVFERIKTWVADTIAERLKPLVDLSQAEDITGLAKGIAFRLSESFGILRREAAAEEIKSLDQTARAQLRKHGLRFGAFNLFFPILLKPAAAELLLTLWCLKLAKDHGLDPDNLPEPPRAGLTSIVVDPSIPEAYYQVYGFHVCGPRAVRVDILERLADQIRPLLSWKPTEAQPEPPRGATGIGAFTVTPEMMSILGCSADELGEVLRTLGFRSERKLVEKKPEPPAEPTRTENAAPADIAEPASDTDTTGAAGETEAENDRAVTAQTADGLLSSAEGSEASAADAEAAQTAEQSPGVQPGDGDSAERPNSAAESAAIDNGSVTVSAPPPVGEASSAAQVASSVSEDSPTTVVAAGDTSSDGPSSASADLQAATAEAAGSDAPSEPEASVKAADEEEAEYIELWRPKRRQDGPRRGRRGGERNRREQNSAGNAEGQDPGKSAGGEEAVAKDGDGGNRRRGKQGQGPRKPQSRPGAAPSRDGRKNDRNRQRDDGRRRGGDRNREDRNKPMVHTSAPKKKGGSVDPDSPFAALSALRQSMDDKDRGA